MHGNPLGSVHACGAHAVGGAARVDQDVGLAGEAGIGIEAVLAVRQLDPGAGAGGVEPGDVERAFTEESGVKLGGRRG
jgi:hypothetical protein